MSGLDFKPRSQIGKHVWSIRGNFPYPKFVKWEIFEAPGEHNYASEDGCWLIGKRISDIYKGERPEYINIPWKRLAYTDSHEAFFETKEKAIQAYQESCNRAMNRIREDAERVK